jgi:hypothetical protein
MAFNQPRPARRIGTAIAAISIGRYGMYGFTHRAPAYLPVARQADRVFKKKAVSTKTFKGIHWLVESNPG